MDEIKAGAFNLRKVPATTNTVAPQKKYDASEDNVPFLYERLPLLLLVAFYTDRWRICELKFS